MAGTEPKRILVPIDFSDHSKRALAYAVTVAGNFASELVLVYVVEPAVYPADLGFGQVTLPNLETELKARGGEELRKLGSAVIGDRVRWSSVVKVGKPYIEILQTASEMRAEMIVIATHGHTSVEHILFGSTTEKVVKKAPCPVLIIRPVQHAS
jgi:nucleotide-binding universal stress UspA family protein